MGLFRYEIIMCEKLRLRPHPRIAEYYGVIAEAGKIVGLALKKYGRCLEDLNGSEPNCPSVDIICSDVQDGLDHLHRLGIAHNDIKPANICIDENNRAVIIDFDSAQRLGEPLGNKGGTPGWSRDSSLSTVENDAYSLAKVRQHLEFTFEGEIRTPAAML
jgi:serine/threonine protein kinase